MERADLCQLLEWDSEFFRRRIARVTVNRLDSESVKRIEKWCSAAQIDCLYFLSEVELDTLQLARRNGFTAVDVRVTFERRTEQAAPAERETSAVVIRQSAETDIQPLREIARDSHHDSRFYQDAHFPRELSDALFERWIEKSCTGYADAVLVAEVDGRVCGYASCHWRDEQGQIGLVGVAAHAQGRGLGKRLIADALRLFAERGKPSVAVVTQGSNVRAQRLYEGCGFLRRSVQVWHHRWFNEPSGLHTEADPRRATTRTTTTEAVCPERIDTVSRGETPS